jgi:hypothetical protein
MEGPERMSKHTPSRLPAMAGVVTGLLAVGLGAWYLATPHAAALLPSALAAPMPQAIASLSRDQAAAKLMELPELKTWSAQIEQRSGGKLHGALVEYDPKPRDVNGQPYYQFTFVEDGEDAAQARESFLVSVQRGDILVEDVISGELLPLQRWRNAEVPNQTH